MAAIGWVVLKISVTVSEKGYKETDRFSAVYGEEDIRAAKDIIENLKNLDSETVILVEGNRDMQSLRNLGVVSEIFVINNGKSVTENSELLSRKYTKVIVLTDWDRTGGRLARNFAEQLAVLGVEFSVEERRKLARLLKKEIKDVESLHKIDEIMTIEKSKKSINTSNSYM